MPKIIAINTTKPVPCRGSTLGTYHEAGGWVEKIEREGDTFVLHQADGLVVVVPLGSVTSWVEARP